MCLKTPKTPKVETPAPPPKVENLDPSNDAITSKAADLRRRKQALSRTDLQAGGAMQGGGAVGKTKLGE